MFAFFLIQQLDHFKIIFIFMIFPAGYLNSIVRRMIHISIALCFQRCRKKKKSERDLWHVGLPGRRLQSLEAKEVI